MSDALKRTSTPEDIWQETLLHAWRDRERCEWHGIGSFRNWLLQIAVNRIRDAADRAGADKRGGSGAVALQARVDGSRSTAGSALDAALVQSTTPSRIAWHKEQADAMRAAIQALPELVREVVRLRLFEERSPDEIALELGISHAAAKHRLRQGSALYRERLAARLASHPSSFPAKD
jgi:RNA polymerase sigma factor (sigma-70 family)